jgi:hypothetical protein
LGRLITGAAGLNSAVANTIAEVFVLAEAGSITSSAPECTSLA